MKNSDQFKAVKFLKAMYSKCDGDGYVNIRIFPDKENLFIPLSKIGSMIPKLKKEYRDKDIYFAVATRNRDDGTKGGIIQIPSLWCDVDFKGRHWEEVWNEVKKFRPRPTAGLKTGGGYHLHWFLQTPGTKDQIPQIENLLKRLASYLGGDFLVTDASHILRVPGTFNYKRDVPYQTRLIMFEPKRRYQLSDFDFLPPVKEEKEPQNEFPSWSDKLLLDGVPEGERNASITKLAGRYAGRNLSKVEILSLLSAANSRFDPPLDEKEVEKTLDSILNTHSKNLDIPDKPYTPQRGEGRGLLQILAEPLEQPDYLIMPFLMTEDKGFLVSSYKVGKTLFAMQLTLCLSKGIPFLGFDVPKPRKVLFIRFELSWRRFKKSLHMMEAGLNPPGQYQAEPVFELVRGFNILDQGDFGWLNKMIDKHEPALLILDPFYKMTSLDLRDTASAMKLIRQFESIRRRYEKLCILINAHQVKNANNAKDWDTTYGPMQFFADMDFELRLRVTNRDSVKAIFTLDHICNDEAIEQMTLRRDPNTLLYYPDHTLKQKKQDRETEEFEKARGLLVSFIQQNSKKPSQTEFRKMIEGELKMKDSKARKIIKTGEDKFWKGLPGGKGRSILYEPVV